MKLEISKGIVLAFSGTLFSSACHPTPAPKAESAAKAVEEEKVLVTPSTYIRAETDGRLATFQKHAGDKVNAFYLIRRPTPTAEQPVVRMSRDTLYGGAVVDTEGGAWVSVPEMPDNRYFSLLLIDNDHYVVDIITKPGRHKIPDGTTKYVAAIPRVQVMDQSEEEIKLVNRILDEFKIEAKSSDPFEPPNWDAESTLALRAQYEKQFVTFKQYPADWMDVKGRANEETRHLAVAGAWGLLPESEVVSINYTGPTDATQCYIGIYEVPPHEAFWSITVYGSDAFMKSDNVTLSDRTAPIDKYGTLTVHFGSEASCGKRVNRLDITEGWNFLMRIYRPGEDALAREYVLPEVRAFIP